MIWLDKARLITKSCACECIESMVSEDYCARRLVQESCEQKREELADKL